MSGHGVALEAYWNNACCHHLLAEQQTITVRHVPIMCAACQSRDSERAPTNINHLTTPHFPGRTQAHLSQAHCTHLSTLTTSWMASLRASGPQSALPPSAVSAEHVLPSCAICAFVRTTISLAYTLCGDGPSWLKGGVLTSCD